MKIMVIGAYGKLGSLLMEQASRRGHTVTGIAHRKHNTPEFSNIIIKDMMELNEKDVAGFDAVIDAVGAWSRETERVHYQGLLRIVWLLKGSKTRYLKVGGANTLYIDADHSKILQQLPLYYPKRMQDLCDAHRIGLEILRTFSDVKWTYVTPAYKFAPFGPYTGKYHVSGEEFVPAAENNPDFGHDDYISYADYAKGMIDMIENGTYIRQRITLVHGDLPDKRLLW